MTTNIVGSDEPDFASEQLEPSNAGYGQNGFGGPSSDTPGTRTASGFLPDPGKPVNSQLRKQDATPIATTFGMKKPAK